MEGLDHDTRLVRDLADHTGLTPSGIAKKAGLAVTTINRPFNGSATTRLSLPTIEKLRSTFPNFPGWSIARDDRSPFRHQPRDESTTDSCENTLRIPVLDLADDALLGTFDPSTIEKDLQGFPTDFLRMFTKSAADQLAFSHGVGDTMEPTIGNEDLFLIDRSYDAIKTNDQIWVVALDGITMVKRVRTDDEGTRLLSDNPKVPDYAVDAEDLAIIGRVIAIVKKV